MDTPVPIPNTEVKHFNAEDSVSENRKLPIFFCFKIILKSFKSIDNIILSELEETAEEICIIN